MKVVPRPSSDARLISPPRFLTIDLTCARPSSLSRLILRAGAAKKIKDPVMVARSDAPSIVLDLDRDTVSRSWVGPDTDRERPFDRSILYCVVEEIAEDLLERPAGPS